MNDTNKWVELAHDLIEKYGDADSGPDELLFLLTENGVPEEIAMDVVQDVRG